MENEFFINAGIPPPPLHFEPTSTPSMHTWISLSSLMEIQAKELNCRYAQSPDCFFNPDWEKSNDQSIHFDSAALRPMVSHAPSNSNISNEGFVIRELIGKMGNIGNCGEISPHSQPLLGSTRLAADSYIGGTNSTNTSGYSTHLSSPPKLNLPIMDQLVKEKLPDLGKSMPSNSCVPEFSADPGFAERAARFSCFDSKSFNGRTNVFRLNNNKELHHRSSPSIGNGKIARVLSSPSLKAPQLGVQQSKNPPLQCQTGNSLEESTLSEQILTGENGLKASNDLSSRKRKEAGANDNSNAKRCKGNEENGTENGPVKTEEEPKGSISSAGEDKQTKTNSKLPEAPKDYIHVRARRGQATDSHSLAERIRREKISERMKLLQDLVPACNKVTGKALMLDEIINYVQLLQRQVEFLSMKLASLNTSLDFNMDTLMTKDIFQTNNPLPHPIFPLDSSALASYEHQSRHNLALHSNISNGIVTSGDPLDMA